jgi:hypothetical protein
MAPSTGRHDADESASDRARIDYLAGEPGGELDPIERAELDELRALLADPTLWSEPPAGLADSVAALIAAESGQTVGNPSAATDLDRAGATGNAPETVVGGAAPEAADPVSDGAGPPVAPNDTLDLATARRRKDSRESRRRFTRPVFLIAAAAAVVAVALSAVLLFRDTGSERRFDVALAATDLVPAATGNASMIQRGSGWEIHLDATGLPRLDNGRFYQAWLRNPDGVLVPIGTFNEGSDVTLWAGVSPANFPTMTITEEAADGDQGSSGQRVLVGTAVEQ